MQIMKKYNVFIVLLSLITSCIIDDNNPIVNPDKKSNNIEVVWQADLLTAVNPGIDKYMPAIDEQGNIFVLLSNYIESSYSIQAFSKDGKQLWANANIKGNSQHSLITYYKEKLFFTTDNEMICIDAKNGSNIWSYSEPDSLNFLCSWSWAIVNDQVVTTLSYGTADGSYLFSFNTSNGNIAWTKKISTDNKVAGFVVADESQLYFIDNKISKFDVSSSGAAMVWEQALPGNTDYKMYNNIRTYPSIDKKGNVIFCYRNPEDSESKHDIISYDKNGNVNWNVTPDLVGGYLAQPQFQMIDSDDNIYHSITDLYKYNGNDGSLSWKAEAPYEFISLGSISHITIGNDGKLYSGDSFGFYVFDKSGNCINQNLDLQWNGNNPLTFATLLPNGNVIMLASGKIDSETPQIYCIKGDSGGVKKGIWAKWGANAANTFNLSN